MSVMRNKSSAASTTAASSAPAAITSPRDIPELDAALHLWLDASDVPYSATGYTAKSTDGGPVAVWQDKSGNNNHCTSGTNKPVFRATGFNGLPCVEFARSPGNSFDAANALPAGVDTSGMSIYVVCDWTGSTNGTCVPLSIAGGTTSFYMNVSPANKQFGGGVGGTGSRPQAFYDTTTTQGVYSLIRDAVQNVVIEGMNDIWLALNMYGTLYSDVSSRRYATTGATNLVGGKIRVGADATPANYWPGKICEVLVFVAPLTDEQDRLIRDYLAAKWGLQRRNLVLCCGNSITSGYAATTGNSQYLLPPGMASIGAQTTADNYPNYLWQALGAGCSVRQDSYSGRRLDAMLPESRKFAPTFVLPSTGRKHVAIVLEGTNEIQQKRTLGYEMFARYCQERRNEGFKVIAATVLKSSAIPGRETFEADRQVYNGRVRANWNRFADALADLGNDALYPELNDPTNAAYANNSGDGLHPNSAGYQRMAQVLAPMVQALVA